MKRNSLLLIILVALVGIAFIVKQGKTRRLSTATANIKQREFLLPDLPVNDIKKIRIREGDKSVNLAVVNGNWDVAERSGYPAAFDKISRALLSLRELKISGGVPIAKENLGSVKLLGPDDGPAENTGLQIDLMNEKGEMLASLVAGKNVETSGGASSGSFSGPGEQRFVRVAKDDGTAWLVSEAFSSLQPNPQDWIDKKFIDVRKLKSVQIAAANAGDSWGAERKDENSEFTLMEPKNGGELDTAKAGGLASLLSNPTFNDVLPKDKATPDFMKGALSAKFATFEDFNYQVKLLDKKEAGKEAESKDYLTVTVTANIPKERKPGKGEKEEDKKKKDEEFAAMKKELEEKLAREKAMEGWVFEVSNYTVNTLLKKRSEILRDKPKPPPTPEIKVPQPAAGTSPAPAAAAPAPAKGSPAPARKPITVTTPPVSIDDAKPMPAKPTVPKPADKKPAGSKPAEPGPTDGKEKPAEKKP